MIVSLLAGYLPSVSLPDGLLGFVSGIGNTFCFFSVGQFPIILLILWCAFPELRICTRATPKVQTKMVALIPGVPRCFFQTFPLVLAAFSKCLVDGFSVAVGAIPKRGLLYFPIALKRGLLARGR